ncbi:MAG: hypothetical protein U9N38_03435 [Thermodesulfobacteriota bacterium]|nr:hypothetical protein [Thermodesulfobacteriota bacterium]
MKRVLAHLKIQVPATIKRKSKWFVASCPVLDIHSQGDTKQKAKENLIEALSLFFVSCHERGTLDAALKECGFETLREEKSDILKLSKEDYIDIPIPFLIKYGDHQGCHV